MVVAVEPYYILRKNNQQKENTVTATAVVNPDDISIQMLTKTNCIEISTAFHQIQSLEKAKYIFDYDT
jgi:hypothetical protein